MGRFPTDPCHSDLTCTVENPQFFDVHCTCTVSALYVHCAKPQLLAMQDDFAHKAADRGRLPAAFLENTTVRLVQLGDLTRTSVQHDHTMSRRVPATYDHVPDKRTHVHCICYEHACGTLPAKLSMAPCTTCAAIPAAVRFSRRMKSARISWRPSAQDLSCRRSRFSTSDRTR